MKAVIQRVRRARVTVGEEIVGEIGHGLCVLVGVERGDEPTDAQELARKLVNLRIFEDEAGKMNLSVKDVGGSLLLVSQFTLLGDTRRGHRPGFSQAMEPEGAARLFEECVAAVAAQGVPVATGRFRAEMLVSLENDGPVTILVDTRARPGSS